MFLTEDLLDMDRIWGSLKRMATSDFFLWETIFAENMPKLTYHFVKPSQF